jgi:hypothetical protein
MKALSKVWAFIKAPVMTAIDKAQAAFPPNRIVALLTPTVFMPASAWLAGWAAAHLPGLPVFSAAQIDGLMIAGALGSATLAYKWVDGWQKHEEGVREIAESRREREFYARHDS